MTPLPKKAARLLRSAAAALEAEAQAAGDLDHPTIRDHARLAREIRRYLKEAQGGQDGR